MLVVVLAVLGHKPVGVSTSWGGCSPTLISTMSSDLIVLVRWGRLYRVSSHLSQRLPSTPEGSPYMQGQGTVTYVVVTTSLSTTTYKCLSACLPARYCRKCPTAVQHLLMYWVSQFDSKGGCSRGSLIIARSARRDQKTGRTPKSAYAIRSR
jgi:hypothetical protein